MPQPGTATAAEHALLAALEPIPQQVGKALESLAIHLALEAIWGGVGAANLYISEQAPWTVRKTDPARADAILYHTAEAVRRLAILARWAIPEACDRLLDQLGQGRDARDFAALATPLEPGTELPPPQGVFPRWSEADVRR